MLRAFIKDRIFSAKLTPGKPPKAPNSCLTVEEVAPVSVAAQAGVRAEDLLVDVKLL